VLLHTNCVPSFVGVSGPAMRGASVHE
jgi:hypothetical protein